jgi:hypothetical protein
MSSGHGTNKPRSEGHPGRQVSAAAFGVGDTVHVPGHGAFQVDSMGKRYFTGINSEGNRLGKTGIGLAAGQTMHGTNPWKVERGADSEHAAWQHAFRPAWADEEE